MQSITHLYRTGGSLIGSFSSENTRAAVYSAINLGMSLNEVSLVGADLSGISLRGVGMRHADLRNANLSDVQLDNVDLCFADLTGVNLTNTRFNCVNLGAAKLAGARIQFDGEGDLLLVGERPILQVGPVGGESRYVTAFLTDKGLRVRAGCFFGTEQEFVTAVRKTHRSNAHSREYRAVLDLFKAHEALWGVKRRRTTTGGRR